MDAPLGRFKASLTISSFSSEAGVGWNCVVVAVTLSSVDTCSCDGEGCRCCPLFVKAKDMHGEASTAAIRRQHVHLELVAWRGCFIVVSGCGGREGGDLSFGRSCPQIV